ncbi:MAG TPA: proline--tRNA ligase [Verrucomicrobiae bacterium]|nr:proline--tRNA ligase [Verrucomicrobiae bacterium]
MKWTESLIPTLRDVPKDAEAASHKLALRAGLVRQLASGVYSYLPLGFLSLRKIIEIVREEMVRAGAQELLLPALHPAELWKKTGRYDSLGEDKLAFKNRAGHEFVLGPTHEEVITDLVANNVKSFRDLPFNLFQIQTKFRDEARPRYGVIRTKEFIMKDAYSFDRDDAGLDRHYQKMAEAYRRIFTRCGLSFHIVHADTGMMGGKMSQEFMVVCPYGEDKVALSDKGYMASVEIAQRSQPSQAAKAAAGDSKPEVFDTPNLRTIDEITHRYKLKAEQMIKTMIFMADEKPVAALVTGSSDVNEVKLRKMLGVSKLRQATSEEIRNSTGAPVGFAGPAGLKIPAYADWDIVEGVDYVTGANEKDKHVKNIRLGRDFKPAGMGDIRFVKDGDLSTDGTPLKLLTTMEIGHIFKLGTRYSDALQAVYLDEKGDRKPIIMGCYGIGVNRILAAAIEEHHDDKGIKWPLSIAPYQVILITLNEKEPKIKDAAEKLYRDLSQAGIDVLYDDRDERAGVKFKDADLVGIPVHLVLGERGLAEGKIEIKYRATGASELVPLEGFDIRQALAKADLPATTGASRA